jgi:aconitate hydratase
MDGIEKLSNTILTPLGNFKYFSLAELAKAGHQIGELPFSIRILLENIVRNFNSISFNETHLENILNWNLKQEHSEVPYLPARVLMQDFTGVPSIVDIASIRSEVARMKKDPQLINPLVPVDLIIDHSVQVDFFGTNYAYERNVALEYERNNERYSLLKWAKGSFNNFNVIPPGMGICHQVNLEYLAKVVTVRDGVIFPDTLIGTDSHTPMINGIGVLGWGVGGIEAEAVMLGQPIYIMLPEVLGLKLIGNLQEGTTSTDMVLSVAELLRKKGVVGKFVEVFGEGLNGLSVPDRATISNMSPEFGCTVTYFPPDQKTLEYLRITGREENHIETVEKYLKTNLLWRENEDRIKYSEVVELNLNDIEPSVAGPKRPQDKIVLTNVKRRLIDIMKDSYKREYVAYDERAEDGWSDEGGQVDVSNLAASSGYKKIKITGFGIKPDQESKSLQSVKIKTDNTEYLLSDGSVVIAAITSCTNTSNPSVMIGAGLLARKAVERGLKTKLWVKTSMAPGSKVVTDYLEKANLLPFLEALGFHTVGYGCTTCIGNSGPLPDNISKVIIENKLVVASVLSGNRNFEARIHPLIKMNFLTSPPLVVVYALTGRMDVDLQNEPLGFDPNLEPVFLRDIWPTTDEIQCVMDSVLESKMFVSNYESIFKGDEKWESLTTPKSNVYQWEQDSSYLREVPFFKNISLIPDKITDIKSARVLLKLGDSITTDHISPAGYIAESSPAGQYLKSQGINKDDFNSYGSRRGNHEVMVRGTFANLRLKNELVAKEGGWTLYHPNGDIITVYDAAVKYKGDGTPLIILAGKEYGSGSSRDWAAKGVSLLGVKAIIAESFERIHRSNLVGMGVLPLQFVNGENSKSLGLTGGEIFEILNIEDLEPNKIIKVRFTRHGDSILEFSVITRLDSPVEIAYFQNGGILQFVLRVLHNLQLQPAENKQHPIKLFLSEIRSLN